MITIRHEQPGDASEVRDVNLRAFGGSDEADLVDRLRVSCSDAISLVANNKDQLLAHILFSPVVIEYSDHEMSGMGLAPMSVLPQYHRQSIGSKLVEAGLEAVRASGHPFVVVVLGHPEYYPRFGFERASKYAVTCEFDVPDEMFMTLLLDEQSPLLSGVARYHREFDVWK